MKLVTVLEEIDGRTARAFVHAARNLIDALLVESARMQQTQTPGEVDYTRGELSRESPAGGWISNAEIAAATQRIAEAIAAEKWTDGVLCAVRLMALFA